MDDIKKPKVIRKYWLRQDDLSVIMVHVEAQNYRTTILKEVAGLKRVVIESGFTANSHRHAIRKLKGWMDERYPVKKSVESRMELEQIFS